MAELIRTLLVCLFTGHRWVPFNGRYFRSRCTRCETLSRKERR